MISNFVISEVVKSFDFNSVTGPGENAVRSPVVFGEDRPAIRVHDPDTGLYRLIIIEDGKEFIVDTFVLGPEGAPGARPRFRFWDYFVSGNWVYYIYSHSDDYYLGTAIRQENGSFAREGEGVFLGEGLNPMEIRRKEFMPPTDNTPLQLRIGNQGAYKIYELSPSGKFELKEAKLPSNP